MLVYLWKDFSRSSSFSVGVALLLFTGLVSIYIGGVFLDQQEETIALAAESQRDGIEHTLDFVADDDVGLFLYYAKFGMVNEVPRIAGLSIGQRDLHPAAQNVNIRNLEEQRHESVLRNPLYQLLGNFDFTFVLVFLFPLIIIAFCFNLYAEEKEGGTWSLVLSHSGAPERILRQKILLRYATVQASLAVLLIIAKLYLAIPMDAYFLALMAVAFLYVTFWFSVSWMVVRLGLSSSHSALTLLLVWVALLIVAPSALSGLAVQLYPTPEAYEAMLESRDGYHNKWDQAKEPTLASFQKIYPQFANYKHPEGESFGWLWYYAMQHLGDVEGAPAAAALNERLQRRIAFSRLTSYLVPSAHAQLSLNTIAHTDLTNYLNFQRQLASFHERKRLAFYPKIFSGEEVSATDWSAYATEHFNDERPIDWVATLLPFVLTIGLLLLLVRFTGVRYTTL